MSILRPYGWSLERVRSPDEIYERFGQSDIPMFSDKREGTQRVYFDAHSSTPIPPFVETGIHLIRNPREIIRSGVLYHRITHEAWAHYPLEEFGGQTYQVVLNQVTDAQALILELKYCRSTLLTMIERTTRSHPKVKSFKYETLTALNEKELADLFKKVCFPLLEIDTITKRLTSVNQNREMLRDLKRPKERRHFSQNIGQKPVWTDEAEEALNDIMGEWLTDWYPQNGC